MAERNWTGPAMTGIADPGRMMQSGAAPALAVIAALTLFVSSTDLYLATMPAIAAALQAPSATIQLTLSLNLAAYAGATLVHGPIADRFGRRSVLMTGLIAFSLASLLCSLAPTVEWLLMARVAQGLAASTGTVLTALILRELFDDVSAQRWMAAMAIASAAGPATAPLIGALTAEAFGWRANFTLLAALGAGVLLFVWLKLPETGSPVRGALHPKAITQRYRRVFTNTASMRYQLVNALSLAALFAFMTAAPFVFIGTFGLSPAIYAGLHGGLVLVYILAAGASARLAGRVAPAHLIIAGLGFGAVGVAILVLGLLIAPEKMMTVVLGMAFNAAAIGLLMSNAWLLLLDHVAPEDRGSASATAGCLQMSCGALASVGVAALPAGSVPAMVGAIGLCSGLTVLAFFALRPARAEQAAP